jgi:hypothetical protein
MVLAVGRQVIGRGLVAFWEGRRVFKVAWGVVSTEASCESIALESL